MSVEIDDCADHRMIEAARAGAVSALQEDRCRTAIVVLTSACLREGHGNHTTMAVASRQPGGAMTPSEARSVCKRLRALADELEQKFVAGKGN